MQRDKVSTANLRAMAEQKYVLAYLMVHEPKLAKKWLKKNSALVSVGKDEAAKLVAILQERLQGADDRQASETLDATSIAIEEALVPSSSKKPTSKRPAKKAAVSLPESAAVVLPAAASEKEEAGTGDEDSDSDSGPRDAKQLHANLERKLAGKALFKDTTKDKTPKAEAASTKKQAPKATDTSADVSMQLELDHSSAAPSAVDAESSAPKSKSKKRKEAPATAAEPAVVESAVVPLEAIVPLSADSEPATKKAKIDAEKGQPRKEKPAKTKNAPFRRVRAEEVELIQTPTWQGGDLNDYGAKAHRDLIVTRGESFRKEKTKKKRGSYKGGDISLESRSIKFD